MKGLDLTRPPIVLLCFGSLIQVYISSQCFTLYVYDSTEEQALGISQGEVRAVCIVTGERERGRETKPHVGGKAGEWVIPLGLTFKYQIGFSYISKAKIFSVFGHMQELLNGDLSLRKDPSINHLHSCCWKRLQTIPMCLANINIDHVHF